MSAIVAWRHQVSRDLHCARCLTHDPSWWVYRLTGHVPRMDAVTEEQYQTIVSERKGFPALCAECDQPIA